MHVKRITDDGCPPLLAKINRYRLGDGRLIFVSIYIAGCKPKLTAEIVKAINVIIILIQSIMTTPGEMFVLEGVSTVMVI